MKYVALLRGIMPMNPNMRNEKLRGVFESLGFKNVRTIIASGNVVFDSKENNAKKLEELIEKSISEQLGFSSATIIRSQQQLEDLVASDPFNGLGHSRSSYLNATFLKNTFNNELSFPYTPEGRNYTYVKEFGNTILSVIDLTNAKTPDLMIHLEKTFGKGITTRTWNTIGKILKIMNE